MDDKGTNRPYTKHTGFKKRRGRRKIRRTEGSTSGREKTIPHRGIDVSERFRLSHGRWEGCQRGILSWGPALWEGPGYGKEIFFFKCRCKYVRKCLKMSFWCVVETARRLKIINF